MKKIQPLLLHRLIRFGGGLAFILTATQFEGAWPLYIFGGIMLVTGFIRPRRCYGECELPAAANDAGESKR